MLPINERRNPCHSGRGGAAMTDNVQHWLRTWYDLLACGGRVLFGAHGSLTTECIALLHVVVCSVKHGTQSLLRLRNLLGPKALPREETVGGPSKQAGEVWI